MGLILRCAALLIVVSLTADALGADDLAGRTLRLARWLAWAFLAFIGLIAAVVIVKRQLKRLT